MHIDKSIQTGRQLVDYLNDHSCREEGHILEVADNKINNLVGEPHAMCRCKSGMKQRKSRSKLKETTSRLPCSGEECKSCITARCDR